MSKDLYEVTSISLQRKQGDLFPDRDETFVGFDPGTTHAGFAVITPNWIKIFQISMKRQDNPILRMLLIQEIWRGLQLPLPYIYNVTVEGAAFGENYRQVELAEIRAAFIMGILHTHNIDKVSIVAPSSIRKVVFGSAKITAHEYWKDLTDMKGNLIQGCNDALAALSCAMYKLKG